MCGLKELKCTTFVPYLRSTYTHVLPACLQKSTVTYENVNVRKIGYETNTPSFSHFDFKSDRFADLSRPSVSCHPIHFQANDPVSRSNTFIGPPGQMNKNIVNFQEMFPMLEDKVLRPACPFCLRQQMFLTVYVCTWMDMHRGHSLSSSSNIPTRKISTLSDISNDIFHMN